jgi:hypothetical protein
MNAKEEEEEEERNGRSRLIDEFSKTPAYANHLDPALLGEFARLFVHVEHSKDMLPSTRVQLLLHGNLQLSGIIDHAHTKKRVTSQKNRMH